MVTRVDGAHGQQGKGHCAQRAQGPPSLRSAERATPGTQLEHSATEGGKCEYIIIQFLSPNATDLLNNNNRASVS